MTTPNAYVLLHADRTMSPLIVDYTIANALEVIKELRTLTTDVSDPDAWLAPVLVTISARAASPTEPIKVRRLTRQDRKLIRTDPYAFARTEGLDLIVYDVKEGVYNMCLCGQPAESEAA